MNAQRTVPANRLFHPPHQALVADFKTYFEWAAVDYTV